MAAATSTACPFSADSEMAATYAPAAVEKNWYNWWKDQGYFRPKSDADPSDKSEPFVIVLPPPNVTGKLHLGHALTASVQDSIVRFNRMKGRNTLYLPGTDHAGIATQVVVEKRLQAKEGKSRHDLGREEFLKKVWEFKHDHSTFIHDQLQLLGSSLDNTRDRFTLDDQCAAAVKEAFVRFHEDGIMYRATRLVNWCCALQSAISDLEVEQVDTEAKSKTTVPNYAKKIDMGLLTHVAYKVVGEDAELVVATTRPETILGDTAIAVHPEDARYTKFHGKFVQCPFRDAQIPIVCDPILVDKEFGTGVVKITPAHDFNDYEAGVRNKLPMISVLNQTGHITMPGQFEGMHRFDARTAIVAELEKLGLMRGQEGHAHRVPRCSRTNDIVEPLLMPQWFLDCTTMAKRSLDAVEKGDLKLTPEHHGTTWRHFLGEIKPWCVSRQLWWGHRIPAYVVVLNGIPVKGDESWVVARTEAEAREKAMKQFNLTAEQAAQVELQQDPDVLDTWFSSGLWPFSTMGWPNESAPDMQRFFPGNLLETGHDILFFWVARMVMMSLHLTNKLPFSEVYLHAMVRDKDGRKMSKALGNVIDPLDVIYGIALQDLHDKLQHGNLDAREIPKAIKFQKEAFPEGIPECGSDALRFGLLTYTQSGRNVNLDIERLVGYRQFGNKLWNATRYILFHALPKGFSPMPLNVADRASLPLECRWILSRLDLAAAECNQGFTEGTYDFAMATTAVYRFWLYELCDVFLELTKPVMAVDGERKTLTQSVLLHAVETGLRLLHPMMPFITEELYHRLPHHAALPSQSIMVAAYPQAAGWRDAATEADMALVQEVVHTVRSMKAQYALTPKVKPEVWIACNSAAALAVLSLQTSLVETLGGCGATVAISKESEAATVPIGCGFQTATPEVGVHMMLKGFISVEKEVAKLAKAIAEKQKILDGHRKKMQMPGYDTKVPQAVRDANTEKESNLVMELANLAEAKLRMEQLQ